ncbi:protein PLASTID REDOX INSENSITIVE 2, chloroplastic [Prosopis cineraria]|uniref:protein PLASTID REDOX INSENSITIVE 2, chloroplastic n=1 Tax=Prosopis cineraria TaxID=364024 RepID=UPI00240F3008|nr:protein PLASTID REDOX INSENSITIVE 2, chloroplastic [Prosopis cineraria]
MSWSAASTSCYAASIFDSIPSSSSSSSLFCVRSLCFSKHRRSYGGTFKQAFSFPSSKEHRFPPSSSTKRFITRAAEYKFPDPIPEFADAETTKFRNHLLKKLSKKDMYGESVEEVVGVCTEIFSTFLHSEYGGPGTLLVLPFIDMADTVNERGLPGGPQAARAAIKWAQNHVDKDWNEWTASDSS